MLLGGEREAPGGRRDSDGAQHRGDSRARRTPTASHSERALAGGWRSGHAQTTTTKGFVSDTMPAHKTEFVYT